MTSAITADADLGSDSVTVAIGVDDSTVSVASRCTTPDNLTGWPQAASRSFFKSEPCASTQYLLGQGLNGKASVSPDLAAMVVANAANPNAIYN